MNLMSERNFIYKNKSYSFDLDLFKKHSSYLFSSEQILNDHDFLLLTEYDFLSNLSNESITTFIQFYQDRHHKFKCTFSQFFIQKIQCQIIN